MSAVCEAFGCPPSVALQQDWALVQAVFDYRNAGHAVDLIDQGAAGFDRLSQYPQLGDLLLAMVRAQEGNHVTMQDVMGSMSERAQEAEAATPADEQEETFG